MKAAKLPVTTILMAFSLALAGVAFDAGASARQPASEQKNQSSLADQTTDDDARKYEEAYNKGDAKRSPNSIPTMWTTLIRTAQRLKDEMPWKGFWLIILCKIPAQN